MEILGRGPECSLTRRRSYCHGWLARSTVTVTVYDSYHDNHRDCYSTVTVTDTARSRSR